MSSEGNDQTQKDAPLEDGLADSPEADAVFPVLDNPRTWGEVFLSDSDGAHRRYRDYQVTDLECAEKKIVHIDGRKVGKTVDVATLVLWYTFVNKGKSILVATPHEGQLNAIIGEVELQINNSDAVRGNLIQSSRGGPKITRKPYYELKFINGCAAYFRLAGAKGDAFRSLHVDYLIVDEAAWLTEAAWKAVRQCLNAGGVFRVYSTPSGIRNGTYYRLTHLKDWRRFNWPSWISPDWTRERERDLEEFYGGKNTAGWQHEVSGEHGMPTYGTFNTAQVMRAFTDLPEYLKVSITGEALADCSSEPEIRSRLETLLNLPGGHGTYWLGGDLGYTSDPTELLLFEEGEGGVLTLILRVHAEQVAYPIISEMIALIDHVYSPTGLGVDRGGNGMSVVQELETLDKYRVQYFGGRLVGYDFGGTIPVGEDSSGNPIKKRVKEHMTSLISRALNARKLRLPEQDHEVLDQLVTHSYTLSERGVIYTKGNDHIVDAMRCALLRQSADGTRTDGLTVTTAPSLPLVPVKIALPGWS